MILEYANEDSGEHYKFSVTYDYCDIEGASFVATSEDGVHEVDGKGHDVDTIKEQLNDYFWELDLREKGVVKASDCHYSH